MNLDSKKDTPLDESVGGNEGEINEDLAITSDREDQIWRQIGETQERARKLGFEFAKLHGGFLGLERAIHLDLSHEAGWGFLSKRAFEVICCDDSGGTDYDCENAFWREIFGATSQHWFPTLIQLIAFQEGICAFWIPVREDFGL